MSGILDLLNSPTGKNLVEGISKQLGLDKGKASAVLSSAIPMIMGGMKNNASTEEGASGLLGAINTKHNGQILDNVESIMGGDNIDNDVMDDGSKILGHVFGGQEENAAQVLSKSNGIDSNGAMNIMKAAAPFVMGFLGKSTKKEGVSDKNGLMGILSGFLGDDDDAQSSLAEKIQKFATNNDTIDGISDIVTSFTKKSGGLGKLLKGLFD